MARALIAWALRALAGCGVVAAALLSLDAAALGPKDPFTPRVMPGTGRQSQTGSQAIYLGHWNGLTGRVSRNRSIAWRS